MAHWEVHIGCHRACPSGCVRLQLLRRADRLCIHNLAGFVAAIIQYVLAVQASEATRAPRSDRQSGRFALAYPTGDRNTSTLLIEQIGPEEVRVGHDYNYQFV